VTLDELADRASGFRAEGGRALRQAIADIRQGAESRPESHLRLLIVGAGLPEPELNQEIHDPTGRLLARVDMLYRFERVIVEYDGAQHRTDDRQYEKDLCGSNDFARPAGRSCKCASRASMETPRALCAESAVHSRARALRGSAKWPTRGSVYQFARPREGRRDDTRG
jgi:hypothetical protein